ncbi:pyranose dehydrogenase [Coprinopsis marcescibilis]|uniref:pyranose dehydrogenase (acceptor) n=1 Tax=Coprinopsis marcescibilis TaxID=230819 RepID=A0A5C3KBR5_COPMA|nr:pyranose dehydrogenase [Coprinopsis marcescibilis]
MLKAASALVSVLFVRAVTSVVLNDSSQLSPNASFDFIIVGSGPGGATVASRLSENPRFSVLLIEAGVDSEGIRDLHIPALHSSVAEVYIWNTTTAPIPSLNNRSVAFPRGYVLGGGSSVNGMVYTRGAASDYDDWAVITKDDGWRWKSLRKNIPRHEKWTLPVSGRNVTGEFDPQYHGFSGNVGVSLPELGHHVLDRVGLEAINEPNQTEFHYNQDMNSGNPIGLGWCQSTVLKGERSSAASSLLNKSARARPNLTILVNTYVTRVLLDENHRNRIRSVEIGSLADRRVLGTIRAKHEVVLAAGVIGTPQILLNSGIGDAGELEALGISPIHNLPDVGKGFIDQALFPMVWLTNGTVAPPIDTEAALEEWVTSRSGPFTDKGLYSHQLFFGRIPSASPLWKKYPDPSSGRSAPHVELLFVGLDGEFPILLVFVSLLTTTSKGFVGIRSRNPFDPPVVNSANLATRFDVDGVTEAVRLAKRFFSGPAWNQTLGTLITPDPDALPAAEWESALRDSVISNAHGVGSAAMSARGSRRGVLDPDLRVKGLDGLRIVDAAAIPRVPTAHTQAPVYLLAERASDLLIQQWK